MDQQFIYVVFSSTPYRIGKFIRRITAEPYNHVSVALDPELTSMYGFARRYYRTPFYGGFVSESRSRYHVNGTPADIRICKIPVTPLQYRNLAHFLEGMHEHKEDYPYNHLSAVASLLRRPVKVRDSYTCIEFCVHILHSLGIDLDPDKYYTVGDVEQLLRSYTVYTGAMPAPDEFDHDYYAKNPIPRPTAATVSSMLTLLKRRKV